MHRGLHLLARCLHRGQAERSRETDLCTVMRPQESFRLAHQEASSSCHRVTSSASFSSCSCSFPAIVIALVAGELR